MNDAPAGGTPAPPLSPLSPEAAAGGENPVGPGPVQTSSVPPRPFPGPFLAVLVTLVFCVVQFLALVLLAAPLAGIARRPLPSLLANLPWIMGAAQVIALAVVLWWALRRNRGARSEILRWKIRPWAIVVPAAVFAWGGFLLVSQLVELAQRVYPMPANLEKFFKAAMEGPLSERWMSLLVIVVIAPIVEEILFRGIILRGLLGHVRPSLAIVWSSLLFGLMHFNFPQGVGAVFLGLFFGWVYLRTRSVGLCCVLHALNNGFAVFTDPTGWWSGGEPAGNLPFWVLASAVLLAAFGLFQIRRMSAEGVQPAGARSAVAT